LANGERLPVTLQSMSIHRQPIRRPEGPRDWMLDALARGARLPQAKERLLHDVARRFIVESKTAHKPPELLAVPAMNVLDDLPGAARRDAVFVHRPLVGHDRHFLQTHQDCKTLHHGSWCRSSGMFMFDGRMLPGTNASPRA